MNKNLKLVIIALVVIAIVVTSALIVPNYLNNSSSLTQTPATKTITDMGGDNVTVPYR